jgi:hypothetical protein
VTDYGLFYPMFAMFLLSGTVLALLFAGRVRAIRAREVAQSYFKVYQGAAEPEYSAQRARHFSNLFEAPTLFYAVCLAAMVTHSANRALVVLAWLYVAARLVHSVIHLGRNDITQRLSAYFASWAVLAAMWIYVALRIAG